MNPDWVSLTCLGLDFKFVNSSTQVPLSNQCHRVVQTEFFLQIPLLQLLVFFHWKQRWKRMEQSTEEDTIGLWCGTEQRRKESFCLLHWCSSWQLGAFTFAEFLDSFWFQWHSATLFLTGGCWETTWKRNSFHLITKLSWQLWRLSAEVDPDRSLLWKVHKACNSCRRRISYKHFWSQL